MKRVRSAVFVKTASALQLQLCRRSPRAVTWTLRSAAFFLCLVFAFHPSLAFAQVSSPAVGTDATAQSATKQQPPDLMLRSIAVLEWEGPAGKPVNSLLVPVAIYTDDRFMDGDNYLANPVPLPVQSGTQYVLQRSGVPQGTYDLDAAGKLRGQWFGSGTWEPLHAANPYAQAASANRGDPDRPHFNAQADSGPDTHKLPTLHRRPPKNIPPPDPNRPVMAYGTPPPNILANYSAKNAAPRQQMVAVSDASPHPVIDWSYRWPNDAARKSMQQQVQLLAQRLLQHFMAQQAKTAADAAAAAAAAEEAEEKKTPQLVVRAKAKPAPSPAPKPAQPALPALTNVDFRCFAFTQTDAASQKTPTCILSADSPVANGPTKYVTVVAKPDIYGVPQAISQSVSDGTDLNAHPRVRLVDVLDAAGDNKGYILFEIDGTTDRQFGIYAMKDGKPKLVYITKKVPF